MSMRLLLDKTGTITFGNRMASGFFPVPGIAERDLAEAAAISSLGDETPEGRSIVAFAREKYGLSPALPVNAELVPFSANTRMSGIDLAERSYRKGAVDSVLKSLGIQAPADFTEAGHPHRPGRQHAACRRFRQPATGCDRAEGYCQTRHPRAFRCLAKNGHPHRDGHRR